jgi:membrane protease YdiL (CAAX protease family)
MPHTPFDHVLFGILLVAGLVEWKWMWPRFLARVKSGDAGARMSLYRSILMQEWIAVACVVGAWIRLHRPFSSLMLPGVFGVRLAVGVVVAIAATVLMVFRNRLILANPEIIQRVQKKLEFGEPLLPHTPTERAIFRAVSATAGVCEELLFRGFLIWYLSAWMGPLAAVIVSSIIFGFAHIYLGYKQVPITGLVGLIMAGLVFASGSLVPAIILHAAVDWNSGDLGYGVLNAEPKG